MTPNDVARRNSQRAGYELIDFVHVALPVYLLDLDSVTIIEKKIPLVDEFLLRCTDQGLARHQDLAGFLGLEESFVVKRLAGLLGTDHVKYEASEDDDARVSLTSRGREALSKAITIQPRRQTITVAIDGITRMPMGTRIDLMKPRDVRAFGLKEIRAFPNHAPELAEVADLDLSLALPRLRRDEPVQRVLSVANIVRRMRRFREAVMLVYKAETGSDIQVSFAVDGRPFPEMDDAFRRVDGVKELKIAEEIASSREETRKALEGLGADDMLIKASLSAKRSRETVRPTIAKLIQLDEEAAQKGELLDRVEVHSEVVRLREEISDLNAQKRTLEQNVADIDVRVLEVHEHRPLFQKALTTATKRLLIVSPWINDTVMTMPRLNALEKLAGRGVEVFVGYGIEDSSDRRSAREGSEAVNYLERLAKSRTNFTFTRLGDTHAKILLVDSSFYAIGSFNWMSFEGDPKRKFREEKSTYVGIARKVDEFFDSYVQRFKK